MLCNMVSSCFDISDVRTYKEYMLCFVFFIPFYRSIFNWFSISTDRHKAEVRRAVNDEKLTTVAQQ